MCIATLEEQYQHLQRSLHLSPADLSHYAGQASLIQNEMRAILDEAAPALCGLCEHKCCEGFPLEGWFSLEDYVLFRLRYERPMMPHNRINRITACSFLTPEGCALPADMRPFTCVKVNCERLNDTLRCLGKENHYNRLRKALDTIHREVSQRIRGTGAALAPAVHPAGNAGTLINNDYAKQKGGTYV